MTEYIRPDTYVPLRLFDATGRTHETAVNAKMDRIDSFAFLGGYILKIVTDEGFLEQPIDEETAGLIYESTDVPVLAREFIYSSEYKLWLKHQDLDDELDNLL